ncbi:MAG TPA: hypothetical protein VF596_13065 [Pyrinomonadaceae bacterium]
MKTEIGFVAGSRRGKRAAGVSFVAQGGSVPNAGAGFETGGGVRIIQIFPDGNLITRVVVGVGRICADEIKTDETMKAVTIAICRMVFIVDFLLFGY